MKLFSKSLLLEIEQQLKLIPVKMDEPILYSEYAIKIMVDALQKLKIFIVKYKFSNQNEEIGFFREIKPKLTSSLIYYSEIYNIESNKPLGSKKAIRKYYNNELLKLTSFFNDNLEFYRYYRTENVCHDSKYFVRGQYDIKMTIDSFYFQTDHRFSTSHDYKVARILANDQIKRFLEDKLWAIKNDRVLPNKIHKWTGSKVDLIELIYALHTEGVINNGKSGLREITTFFESAFDIDLGQFNRVFLEIRNRKSERTKFLNSLRSKLILRMEDADEN